MWQKIGPQHNLQPSLRFLAQVIFVVVLPAAAEAQFDYGISAGGMFTELHARPSTDPHVTSTIGYVDHAAFSASAYYRERYSEYVNLGVDLTLVHRSFGGTYANGGLGGGYTRYWHGELDQLYVGLKPEVRLDTKRFAVLRFGVMAGFRVGGHVRGNSSTWSIFGTPGSEPESDFTSLFGGDLRFVFGVGLRFPIGEHWAITLDPEANVAVTSMLKDSGGYRGSDIGLRIGFSRCSQGKSLSRLFKDDRVKRDDIW